MPTSSPPKIYCYVDETGQDAGSDVFIVAAVIAWDKVDQLRSSLLALEEKSKVGSRKWHKLRHVSRMEFMSEFLRENFENLQMTIPKTRSGILPNH